MKESFGDFLNLTSEKELLELIKDSNGQNEIVEVFMNSLIKAEFEMFMGYKKYERKGIESTNYRNGSHTKNLKTTSGEITLTVPEDRNSEFDPVSVPKHMRRTEEMTRAIMQLFAMGNSNAEVVKFVDKVFGCSYKPQTISTIVEVLDEIVQEFNSRTIKSSYFAIFMDATYIPIRFDGTYSKQAVHIMVGVDQEGYQEILGYTIGHTESSILWEEFIINLKERGLEHCDLFVMDGAPGVAKVVRSQFPTTKIQQCTVHLARNIKAKIRPSDRSHIMGVFSEIFKLTDKGLIDAVFSNLVIDYPQYKRVLHNFMDNEFMFTYLEFPHCVHKLIKTTNRIERINGQIKTLISHKRSFPNEKSLERILVSGIIEINTKSTRTCQGMQEYIIIK